MVICATEMPADTFAERQNFPGLRALEDLMIKNKPGGASLRRPALGR
jgi:hypothetical protein